MAAAAAAPSYEALKAVDRAAGATSQQRPLMDAQLRAAQAAASGPGRTVLDTIVSWDGDYDREDANGTVDPGVAAFDALKDAAEARLPARRSPGSASAAVRIRSTSAGPRRPC